MHRNTICSLAHPHQNFYTKNNLTFCYVDTKHFPQLDLLYHTLFSFFVQFHSIWIGVFEFDLFENQNWFTRKLEIFSNENPLNSLSLFIYPDTKIKRN